MVDLWRIARPIVGPEDRGFERAFQRFGGAREWMVRQLAFPRQAVVMEIGYGQGLFTVTLASHLPEGKVVAIDKLSAPSIVGGTRWYAQHTRVASRIELVQGDAIRLPSKDESFDGVASFLALQDIVVSSGRAAIFRLLREIWRVARPGCKIGIADDCFPESRPSGTQGRLFDAMRRYWHNRLPPVAQVQRQLAALGGSELEVKEFDPGESLRPRDAERELRLAAKFARPQGVDVDFEAFWNEVAPIVRREGRRYAAIRFITGRKPAKGRPRLPSLMR